MKISFSLVVILFFISSVFAEEDSVLGRYLISVQEPHQRLELIRNYVKSLEKVYKEEQEENVLKFVLPAFLEDLSLLKTSLPTLSENSPFCRHSEQLESYIEKFQKQIQIKLDILIRPSKGSIALK